MYSPASRPMAMPLPPAYSTSGRPKTPVYGAERDALTGLAPPNKGHRGSHHSSHGSSSHKKHSHHSTQSYGSCVPEAGLESLSGFTGVNHEPTTPSSLLLSLSSASSSSSSSPSASASSAGSRRRWETSSQRQHPQQHDRLRESGELRYQSEDKKEQLEYLYREDPATAVDEHQPLLGRNGNSPNAVPTSSISFPQSSTAQSALVEFCRDFSMGLVNSVMTIPCMYGYASIIFSHPAYRPLLPLLSKLVLLSSVVHQLCFTLKSTLPFAIGQVQDAGLLFLSAMATSIAHLILKEPTTASVTAAAATTATESVTKHSGHVLHAAAQTHLSPHLVASVSASTVVTLSLATALLGIALIGIGKLRLAKLVSYLPMPVVAGYLAFIGFFCLLAGLSLCVGEAINTITDIPVLFNWHSVILCIPGVVFGGLLTLISRKCTHPLAVPGYIAAMPIVFYIVIAACGMSIQDARNYGWISPLEPTSSFIQVFDLFDFSNVQWSVVPPQFSQWLAMVFVVSFSSCLDVVAIQMDLGKPLDVDHELITVGTSNLYSGILGGYTGSYIFSQTIFTCRSGVASRLVGWVVAISEILIFFLPYDVMSYVPRFFFAANLTFIAFDLMEEWLVDIWWSRRVLLNEYLTTWITFVATTVTNIQTGLFVGMIAAAANFIVSYSQAPAAHPVVAHSNVIRDCSSSRLLASRTGEIVTIKLNGYIFFGSSMSILETVKKSLKVAVDIAVVPQSATESGNIEGSNHLEVVGHNIDPANGVAFNLSGNQEERVVQSTRSVLSQDPLIAGVLVPGSTSGVLAPSRARTASNSSINSPAKSPLRQDNSETSITERSHHPPSSFLFPSPPGLLPASSSSLCKGSVSTPVLMSLENAQKIPILNIISERTSGSSIASASNSIECSPASAFSLGPKTSEPSVVLSSHSSVQDHETENLELPVQAVVNTTIAAMLHKHDIKPGDYFIGDNVCPSSNEPNKSSLVDETVNRTPNYHMDICVSPNSDPVQHLATVSQPSEISREASTIGSDSRAGAAQASYHDSIPVPFVETKVLVLDLTEVYGIDTTAVRSCFLLITHLCRSHNIDLVFTGMKEDTYGVFVRNNVIEDKGEDEACDEEKHLESLETKDSVKRKSLYDIALPPLPDVDKEDAVVCIADTLNTGLDWAELRVLRHAQITLARITAAAQANRNSQMGQKLAAQLYTIPQNDKDECISPNASEMSNGEGSVIDEQFIFQNELAKLEVLGRGRLRVVDVLSDILVTCDLNHQSLLTMPTHNALNPSVAGHHKHHKTHHKRHSNEHEDNQTETELVSSPQSLDSVGTALSLSASQSSLPSAQSEKLLELASFFTVVSLPPGGALFFPGEDSDAVFILLDGVVDLLQPRSARSVDQLYHEFLGPSSSSVEKLAFSSHRQKPAGLINKDSSSVMSAVSPSQCSTPFWSSLVYTAPNISPVSLRTLLRSSLLGCVVTDQMIRYMTGSPSVSSFIQATTPRHDQHQQQSSLDQFTLQNRIRRGVVFGDLGFLLGQRRRHLALVPLPLSLSSMYTIEDGTSVTCDIDGSNQEIARVSLKDSSSNDNNDDGVSSSLAKTRRIPSVPSMSCIPSYPSAATLAASSQRSTATSSPVSRGKVLPEKDSFSAQPQKCNLADIPPAIGMARSVTGEWVFEEDVSVPAGGALVAALPRSRYIELTTEHPELASLLQTILLKSLSLSVSFDELYQN